ncbi:MAG: chemotaxis protein CheW [Marinilabiliaceae bacterium]|nr:chemotaxis protein CheW [Marinilabiliaceae bacterium]
MTNLLNSYLIFKIGEENFGINVAKVMEIREYVPPKAIPHSFPFVAGVTEYQDEIIPLIDAGLKFGMAPVKITATTCTVVLELSDDKNKDGYKLGISIDSVSDVLEIEESKMKNVTVEDYKPAFISSFYIHGDRMIYILDADMIFNNREVVALMHVSDQPLTSAQKKEPETE